VAHVQLLLEPTTATDTYISGSLLLPPTVATGTPNFFVAY
jgi:hypothetical protein